MGRGRIGVEPFRFSARMSGTDLAQRWEELERCGEGSGWKCFILSASWERSYAELGLSSFSQKSPFYDEAFSRNGGLENPPSGLSSSSQKSPSLCAKNMDLK